MYVNVVRVCVLVAVGKVWKKTNTTSKSRGFWNYARERGESHYQRYVSYSVKWEWEAVISQHSSPDLGINNVTKSVRCHRLATAPLFTSQQTRSAAQGPASNYWTLSQSSTRLNEGGETESDVQTSSSPPSFLNLEMFLLSNIHRVMSDGNLTVLPQVNNPLDKNPMFEASFKAPLPWRRYPLLPGYSVTQPHSSDHPRGTGTSSPRWYRLFDSL